MMRLEVAEALVIRPGDRLLIRMPADTSASRMDEMVFALRELRELFPGVEVAVVAAEQIAVQHTDTGAI